MSNWVLMPAEDYQSACNMIRSKTGTSSVIKSGEFAGKLDTIQNVDVSGVTAVASDVLDGKVFVNKSGAVTNGSLPNKTGTNGQITSTGGYTIPAGYYSGTEKVSIATAQQNNIVPDNIRAGTSILGVTGTLPWSMRLRTSTRRYSDMNTHYTVDLTFQQYEDVTKDPITGASVTPKSFTVEKFTVNDEDWTDNVTSVSVSGYNVTLRVSPSIIGMGETLQAIILVKY